MANSSLQIIAIIITTVTLLACDRQESKVSVPRSPPVTKMIVRDTQIGSGAEATNHSSVVVHYTGWLYDPTAEKMRGKQFDSSRGDDLNKPQPFQFVIGAHQVIPGWDQGIMGMKVGGTRVLIIPSDLAYGERGAGQGLIPKNATLIFDIDLLDVK